MGARVKLQSLGPVSQTLRTLLFCFMIYAMIQMNNKVKNCEYELGLHQARIETLIHDHKLSRADSGNYSVQKDPLSKDSMLKPKASRTGCQIQVRKRREILEKPIIINQASQMSWFDDQYEDKNWECSVLDYEGSKLEENSGQWIEWEIREVCILCSTK